MSRLFKWPASPTPDSISSCGELMAPPLRITSSSAEAFFFEPDLGTI
jgi:hypothetical protein